MANTQNRTEKSVEIMLNLKRDPALLQGALRGVTKKKQSPSARRSKKGKPSPKQVQSRLAGRLSSARDGASGFRRFLCDGLHVCKPGFKLTGEVALTVVRYLLDQGVGTSYGVLADVTYLLLRRTADTACQCPD